MPREKFGQSTDIESNSNTELQHLASHTEIYPIETERRDYFPHTHYIPNLFQSNVPFFHLFSDLPMFSRSLASVEHFLCCYFMNQTLFQNHLQLRTKFMKQCQEISQNCAGYRNSNIYFCLIFDHQYQSLISGREAGYQALLSVSFQIFSDTYLLRS